MFSLLGAQSICHDGNKQWRGKGGRGRFKITRPCHTKWTTAIPKKNISCDFGFVYVESLWLNVCLIRMKRRKAKPTYAVHFFLKACQPPIDLAINLQYKRSLISGSLILKWIIISLHQSSPLNVKCLQFIKWPLLQPWSELLTREWTPLMEIQ